MKFSHLRVVLKVMGVTLVILGIITLFYTLFIMPSIHFIYTFNPLELREVNENNGFSSPGFGTLRNQWWTSYFDVLAYRTYHTSIGFVGFVLMFMGYKSYRFIPSSERED